MVWGFFYLLIRKQIKTFTNIRRTQDAHNTQSKHIIGCVKGMFSDMSRVCSDDTPEKRMCRYGQRSKAVAENYPMPMIGGFGRVCQGCAFGYVIQNI